MAPSTDHRTDPGSVLHLHPEQLDRLRAELLVIADDHRRRAQESEELFKALAADSSIDAAERQSARLAGLQAAAIQQDAERAVAAMDAGTYGFCEGCAAPIPFERLEAIPMTDRCVACHR